MSDKISPENPLIAYLKKVKRPVALEASNQEPEEVRAELKKLDVALCIPLIFEDKLIGIFNLGEKLSEEPYSSEDIDLLTTLSNQLAIAIENAKLNEEKLTAEKQLLLADKLSSLGRIAAGMAHEIKNPLAAIKGMTQAIEQNPEDAETLKDFKEVIPKEIDRLNNLVENLVRLGKQPKPQMTKVDINNTLENMLKLFESRCRNHKIEIKKDLQPVPEIKADKEQLIQVFTNLMLNAIQAIKNNGTLSIKTQNLNNNVILEISDTGQGIAPKKLKSIFEPFFSTKEEGMGLGLAVTYKIIKDHGGEIEVESKLGQGTKFRIIL